MFKKKPSIKNLSPLRSSDRRKLADQIISDYQIPIPQPSQATEPPSTEDTTSQSIPTLSSLRASLLPESTSSARYTTTSGPNATPISGTIYVASTPSDPVERILYFSIGKDPRLIPTVYALWNNPSLVPLLHTADFVAEEKLKGGAELMVPGLLRPKDGWDERAKKGSIVAVAGVSKATVPVWVGKCEIDVSGLGDVRGMKGVGVNGLHWEGDEVWDWTNSGLGGRQAPESIDGWGGLAKGLTERLQDLDVDDEDDDALEDGGVALDKSNVDISQNTSILIETNGGSDDHPHDDEEQDVEPSTKEVDEAFQQALIYSLYNAKKHNHPPAYGFDFPLQASFLIANMIQPHLRFPNQHYTIKKTSWKNAKKYIKHLDKQMLLKSKDRNGGETVILDIDFEDQQIKDFKPYKLPKLKPKAADDANGSTTTATSGDQSLNQTLNIQTLYRASSKLVPDLLPSKTQFYTPQQVTAALKAYIEANPNLTNGVSVSRNIRLDPFIANSILSSNFSQTDAQALKRGEIDRGTLNRRILDDDHLCIPYHLILRNDQTYSPENPSSDFKPRPGAVPTINLTIEKRTGTKLVTRISHLEPFHINPTLLAPELQKKCAGSASVSQLVGGKPGMMEIIVQGDQRDVIIKDVLAKRGINPKWVEVVDKGKGKRK